PARAVPADFAPAAASARAVPAGLAPATAAPARAAALRAARRVPPPLPPNPPAPAAPPRQRPDAEETWQTAADDGWRAAAAASKPSTAGTTRSGLPKRVPAAQLVPGGIDNQAAGVKARRTPDEVRGLLSAYHRGVQRGRTGDGGGPAQRSTNEERH